MPAKVKVTKEMILDAAFAVARETGAENINARTVSERLHCSTQPVMYHFATIEELKRTVYAKADQYHSDYLMRIKKPQKGAALGIGMNYIRFAIEEPHLFRFLFQSDYFNGSTLLELIDAEELTPVLSAMQGVLGIGMEQTKQLIESVKPGQRIAIFIGPEGGFDPEEIRLATEAGIQPITLGKRILRTETAGFTTIAWLMYQLEN